MSKFFFDKIDREVIILEVDNGQRCLFCKDKCPGFSPHAWRIICNNCKCSRYSHDIYHQNFVDVKDRIGFNDLSNANKINLKEITLNEGYSWIPFGLTAEKIKEYFLQIPSRKVPRLGTVGENYRNQQLMLQLPKQDFALRYCKFLDYDYQNNFYDFKNERDKNALDIGYVKEVIDSSSNCYHCTKLVIQGSLVIIAPKFGEGVCWHPVCFICCICKELLVDLVYCLKDQKLYCERHYAEVFRPRCAACDELIFARECVKAMQKDWHVTHFCCEKCDNSLSGQSFVIREEHPYCIQCYETEFSNICDGCGKIIGIDSKDLSYKNRHWHEECFVCCKCHEKLINKQFLLQERNIYCSTCHDTSQSSKCQGCKEVFQAGIKKVEYKRKQWHEKCFCCNICQNPIKIENFIPKDNEIYCSSCYEQKFFVKCIKCKHIITTDELKYRNESWHTDCFCCTNCQINLAGQQFTSHNEKPYCFECFVETFAKQYTGGTRFVCFENQAWHPDCFLCTKCNKSLVGKGFISDGSSKMCPECAN
ncbi:prickle planar cell polarity protein 3-like isoform X2 [Centruroides vittatus]|uniref:prickle planar cell polarity protein 3-like isoform X2 n=1 Tax=Centruroides vittatus TaxID=120091 RepID=UPI00350F0D70